VKKSNLLRTLAALLLGVAVAGAPALSYAEHAGGGGGGHVGGGGAHFGGGGGAHFGGARYGGRVGGYAVAGGRYYGGAGATRGYATTHYSAGYTAGRISAPVTVAHGGGFAAGRAYYGHGVWGAGRAWGGGYWHGVFWPRAWFYPGFAWFLPVLPIGYATFWWGGLPYYYYNNLYYTYSPADSGYVVTEPPPAAGDDSGDPGQAGTAGQPAVPAPPAGSAANIYLYPRNGQSDQQMANDRYECHSWAVGQTGFDPTQGGAQSGNPDDYRRAMISCLDARGYSAR
jgi:hypothetical protein